MNLIGVPRFYCVTHKEKTWKDIVVLFFEADPKLGFSHGQPTIGIGLSSASVYLFIFSSMGGIGDFISLLL